MAIVSRGDVDHAVIQESADLIAEHAGRGVTRVGALSKDPRWRELYLSISEVLCIGDCRARDDGLEHTRTAVAAPRARHQDR